MMSLELESVHARHERRLERTGGGCKELMCRLTVV